jgi:hypothetical protein
MKTLKLHRFFINIINFVWINLKNCKILHESLISKKRKKDQVLKFFIWIQQYKNSDGKKGAAFCEAKLLNFTAKTNIFLILNIILYTWSINTSMMILELD